MKTYFSRHTDELDVDTPTRQRLWDERIAAIHFPDYVDGFRFPDNESLDPEDYPPLAARYVKILREISADGGYVLAEHSGHTEYLAGRVDPGTTIEFIRGRWGTISEPAVLKGFHLRNPQVIPQGDIADLLAVRPRRGTIHRWWKAGDRVAILVDGPDAILDVNQDQRAYDAWNELADFAKSKQTLSYGLLGKLTGVHHRVVKYALALIQDYCIENKLPPLTILVVNDSGRPGTGFIAWPPENFEEGLQQVFSFDWRAYGNPFLFAARGARREQVINALISKSTSAEDRYAITKVRGAAQMFFRETMIRAYNGVCAFSGSTIPEALEAAHILPWRYSNTEERLDPGNGILLTAWHHRLFDAGLLRLSEDCTIRVDPQLLASANDFDQAALAAIDGRALRRPTDPNHCPNPALIRKRNELLD